MDEVFIIHLKENGMMLTGVFSLQINFVTVLGYYSKQLLQKNFSLALTKVSHITRNGFKAYDSQSNYK